MIRQTTNYTCGATALMAVKYLLNIIDKKDFSSNFEQQLSNNLNGKKIIGIDHVNLISFAKEHDKLSKYLVNYGEDTYQNDCIAIANIRNWRSGIGHYVVILSKNKSYYKIFDPIDGLIHNVHESDFEWLNKSGKLKKWSINFKSIKYNDIENEDLIPVTHIIKGKNDPFYEVYDTVTFLEDIYKKQGKLVSIETEDTIAVVDNNLYLGSRMVHEGDTIWLKIDPEQSEYYFNILRVLSLFEDKINFINKPSLILRYDDKTLPFKILKRNSMILCSEESIRKSFYKSKKSVVKRMNGFGGKDISFIDKEYSNNSFSYPVIKEDDISRDDDNNVDTRIFWYKGKYVGAVRRFSNGSKFCNMTQNGTHKSLFFKDAILEKDNEFSFSNNVKKDLDNISLFLKKEGFVIAGVDVLNGKVVTEINVSNPSVFKNYIEDTGDNFIEHS